MPGQGSGPEGQVPTAAAAALDRDDQLERWPGHVLERSGARGFDILPADWDERAPS